MDKQMAKNQGTGGKETPPPKKEKNKNNKRKKLGYDFDVYQFS